MPSIEKYNSPAKVQRTGNDSIYGMGNDGTVVIASNVSLSRDMYYSNLTINAGVHLNTNGYRVFVKNTLTLNGTIGISAGSDIATATLSGTPAVATSTTNSIGGSAAGGTYTASQLPANIVYALENALNGFYVQSNGTISIFSGGAGGENGAAGVVTPGTAGSGAGASPTTWPNQSGTLNRDIGTPGGPGARGANGTNGAAGSTPPAAAGGLGAKGGGVVLVVAKTIVGSGTILSNGSNGSAGGPSATGTGATNGAAGATGASTPSAHLRHYTNSHAHYQTGNGSGPHASVPSIALPSTYVAAASGDHAHGTWTHTSHSGTPAFPANSHDGHSPHWGHASVSYAHQPPSSYFSQNSVDHAAGGHLGHSGAVAHYYSSTPTISANYYHETDHHGVHHAGKHHHDSASRSRYDAGGYHHNGVSRNAGASRHDTHNSFAGGTGGPGGTAGTPGTNGSTTAGSNGRSGGGGGIIIITDSISGSTNKQAIGGTIGGVSGSNGNIITILNT